ncbi:MULTISPECIES: acyltransferase [Pontibacter]|uniref:acyltransferase n=1 Tax=Pontibacter TaxID=323449 RepID=UPI001C9A90C2|nr:MULTISPECIES: acyltransferase [Pontibacter]
MLKYINLNTLRFNFHYFPFKIAIKLPVLVSSNVYLHTLKGQVQLLSDVSFGMIKIGFGNVGIFDKKKSRTIWEVNGLIKFKKSIFIGHGARISVGKNGVIIFGNRFNLTAESSIVAFLEVSFGDDCLISWDCLIMDTDFHSITKENQKINEDKPIVILDKVWISARCTILKGSIIPYGSVIAAGSIVHQKLSINRCIYAGNPLRVVKELVDWSI